MRQSLDLSSKNIPRHLRTRLLALTSLFPHCLNSIEEEMGGRDASIVVSLYKQLPKSHPKKTQKLLSKIYSQTESLSRKELDRLE